MKNSKKILIAGGTGFIGSHLAKKCIKKNWEVHCLSLKKPNLKCKIYGVKYINCDVTNFKKLKKKIRPIYDFVINLSGYINHKNEKKTFLTHYKGCKNLTKVFFNNFPKLFIQVGTSLEYGNKKSPHKENINLNGITLKTNYVRSKYLATKHILDLFKNKNFPGSVIRFYQVYGPGQATKRLIPFVINNCKKNVIFPCSSGIQSRDFLFIDDAVDAILKLFLKKKKAYGKIFNIGYGKPTKIKKIILLIKKIIGKGSPLFGKIKLRKEESMTFYPSIQKAKKILKWKPNYNIDRGIRLTIKNY